MRTGIATAIAPRSIYAVREDLLRWAVDTSGSIVDTTVVAGRVLMRGGQVEGEAEIVARARERARRLGIG